MKKIFSHKTLLVIIFIGAFLRLYHLGEKSLWYDEAMLYWIAQGSWKEVIHNNLIYNSAPPTFALIINLICKLGTSEVYLRLLSSIISIFSIPLMYIFAREFVSKRSAYITSACFALAYTLIKSAQYLREYSITLFLALLMLICFYRYLKKGESKYLILFTLFSVSGLFFQYGLALLLFSCNVIFIFQFFSKRIQILPWIVSQLILLAASGLVYKISLNFHVNESSFPTAGYLSDYFWQKNLPSFFTLLFKNSSKLLFFAFPSPIFIVVLFLGIRKQNFYFIIPVIVTFVFALFRLYPYGGIRQDIYLLPMIYLLFALGVEYLLSFNWRRWLRIMFDLLLVMNGLIFCCYYFYSDGIEEIKPLLQTVVKEMKSGEKIFVSSGTEIAFKYYYKSSDQVFFQSKMNNFSNFSDPVWLVITHDNKDQVIKNFSTNYNLKLVESHKNDAFLYKADPIPEKIRDGIVN